jgi:DNA-binding transcriptional ArsR family regulator
MAAQFAIIPDYLIEASPAALRVYFYLALRADHKSGQCWPSQATIGEALDVSDRTVRRALQILLEMGALEVNRRFTDAGDQTSNLYTLPFAISRGRGRTPVSRGGGHPRPHRVDTSVREVGSPVSDNPDSSSEPIDPEALNALPREEGEPWGTYLIRLAAFGVP